MPQKRPEPGLGRVFGLAYELRRAIRIHDLSHAAAEASLINVVYRAARHDELEGVAPETVVPVCFSILGAEPQPEGTE